MQTVSAEYLAGINEGRAIYRAEGMANATAHVDNLRATLRGFSGQSPVGQMLRGELDFWRNQIKESNQS